MLLNRKTIILSLAILMLTILACDFSFNTGDSEAEQTLQAIYIEQTMAVMDAEEAEAAPEQETVAEPTATIEIIHSITPGTPGWVSQWWLDTDSSSTASQKRANGGDALNINLLERPFTAQEMDYRPDLDLQRVEISYDTNFYYFLLTLDGLNPNTNTLSAFYGVELDIDKDSRGDLLLWALGDGSTQWNIADVYVYSDNNDDVGGPRPMLADAPSSNLDGYETALFSPENLSDPDAAWKRVDPGDATVMQLAIKKSLMNNASTFMWSAWRTMVSKMQPCSITTTSSPYPTPVPPSAASPITRSKPSIWPITPAGWLTVMNPPATNPTSARNPSPPPRQDQPTNPNRNRLVNALKIAPSSMTRNAANIADSPGAAPLNFHATRQRSSAGLEISFVYQL